MNKFLPKCYILITFLILSASFSTESTIKKNFSSSKGKVTPRKQGKKMVFLVGKKKLTKSLSKIVKLELEKTELKFGFIKLTDMAPLAIALKMGYFKEEGLNVTLEVQQNWTDVLNKVIDDELDGSQMLASQPIAAAVGCGRKAELITPFSMDLNGNAITVSKEVWSKMIDSIPREYGKTMHPISARSIANAINYFKKNSKPFKFGIVAQYATHNYQLRYWLAAAGINPGYYDYNSSQGFKGTIGGDIDLEVIAPPKMPGSMQQGDISGYCAGEPWNQEAVELGIGVPVIASRNIWKNHPEKLFVVTKKFMKQYPNTLVAITKALIRAGKWLDNPENRKQASNMIAKPEFLGGNKKVIDNSMTGTYEYEKGDVRLTPDFNVFFKYNATYPFYSDGIWYLTQMRRWNQVTESHPDEWYQSKIKEVYKPEIWLEAAKLLLTEGFLEKREIPETDGYREASIDFIDNLTYDGRKPVAYLNSLKIGKK
jgi:nitrate/nitrite transport system substrate-binding protein